MSIRQTWGFCLISVAIAFMAGLLIGRSLASKVHGSASRARFPVSEPRDRDLTGFQMDHASKDHDSEIIGLKAEIASIKAQRREKTVLEKQAAAKEVYGVLFQQSSNSSPAARIDYLRIMDYFADLDEDCADYFIKQYQDSLNRTPDPDRIALMLLMKCGGESVSAFLKDRLKDADSSVLERSLILSHLGGVASVLTRANGIPMDGELVGMAWNLARSGKAEERVGGIGLLGGVKEASTRDYLSAVVASESNTAILEAAIRSLGKCGDKQSLEYLTRYYSDRKSGRSGLLSKKLEQALLDAIGDLLVVNPEGLDR